MSNVAARRFPADVKLFCVTMNNVADGFYYRKVFKDSRLAFHLGMINLLFIVYALIKEV